jgi:sodium-dependent dicarboxylate transporter 2/3/5
MNIVSIIVLTFFVYFVLPELWDITINSFPINLTK